MSDDRPSLRLVDESYEDLSRAVREAERRRLPGGGGGGTSGGVTDDWKEAVDRQLAQLHGDLRNLLYGLIGGFLFLIVAIGGLYVHVDGKFDRVNERAAAMQVSTERINARLDASNQRLDRIEGKLDAVLK